MRGIATGTRHDERRRGARQRRLLTWGVALVVILASVASSVTHAQFVVRDPAVIARNAITARLQQLVWGQHNQQREQLVRMARRLSAYTNLVKYAIQETPEWRIHDWWTEAVHFARDYHAALTYGDRQGTGYAAVTIPLLRLADRLMPVTLGPAAQREILARLATIDATDAVTISNSHDTGALRFNGRREQAAIEGLQAHVIDPSAEDSTTAVLDKISGASLVATRQGQARAQFIAGIVEQLVLETKRARDTEATALNMQLTTWRESEAVNRAFASGTGDALRTWRQP